MHVKKGDNVLILKGKDAGKTGDIVRAFPKENKIIVSGRNMIKKNQKPRRSNEKGQIISKEMPINASNVRLTSEAPKPKVVKAKISAKKLPANKLKS